MWLRLPLILICLGLTALLIFNPPERGRRTFFVPVAAAIVLIIWGGKSESQKRGYHF